jgi:hypothetical protein
LDLSASDQEGLVHGSEPSSLLKGGKCFDYQGAHYFCTYFITTWIIILEMLTGFQLVKKKLEKAVALEHLLVSNHS